MPFGASRVSAFGDYEPKLALDCRRSILSGSMNGSATVETFFIGPTLVDVVPDAARKRELGQYLTPKPIAALMASLFDCQQKEIRLLDAGAGAGALTRALVKRLCNQASPPRKIFVEAYEIDDAILCTLRQVLELCRHECARHEVEFSAILHHRDFIEAATALVCGDFFSEPTIPFNAAILNPPYRKINSDSKARRLLRRAEIEVSNLYTGFVALASKLLCEGGQLVAICPRSFCNGPYFKAFRQQFLQGMSLRRLHVFESRSSAFREDEILQENIIVHAVKSKVKPSVVTISTSSGEPSAQTVKRECAYEDVVSPRDSDQFIHLVVADEDQAARNRIARFTTTLNDLGLDVSTGRVVDFRAKEFIVQKPQENTVPLIYPGHFNGNYVQWPKLGGRKPNAIINDERIEELLVPGAIYVLVKRFSAKEERRRLVACIYNPELVPAQRVGFENHLNYFHARGRGLTLDLARGLSALLNSTILDVYFRQFNGHTQVNATDLRNLRYPSRAALESLGKKIGESLPSQADLDIFVEKEFF